MGRNTIKKGTITIAGLNVADINEDSLFKNINYVGIGSTFFKGTVRENLLMANPKACDEMLWSVLAECDIDGFFKEEKGLDTLLTENTGNLSGGQKQRLALARAILHDAKVYIFDEATSNIDIESEELILSEIKKLARTNTVIMITHRLMNVTDADRIYDSCGAFRNTRVPYGRVYTDSWRRGNTDRAGAEDEDITEYACAAVAFFCLTESDISPFGAKNKSLYSLHFAGNHKRQGI